MVYMSQMGAKSLTKDLVDYLCQQVHERNISAWKAAEIAKISLRAMLKELADRNIPSYDEAALKEDLRFVEK